MAILSSNVERSIAILIHTVNFPTWWEVKKSVSQRSMWRETERAAAPHPSSLDKQQSHCYHFGWGSESVWSVREWLPCAGGSSLLCSVKIENKKETIHIIPLYLYWQQWKNSKTNNRAPSDLVKLHFMFKCDENKSQLHVFFWFQLLFIHQRVNPSSNQCHGDTLWTNLQCIVVQHYTGV